MAEPPSFPISATDRRASILFVSITAVLLSLSIATLAARITLKIRSKLLITVDDYLIVAGFVFAIITWALLLAVIALCVPTSRLSLDLAQFELVIKLGVLGVPIWILSTACIKLSVAAMLLRFSANSGWRKFLWVLMGMIGATSVGFFLFDLLQCIPLAAAWDPASYPKARCVNSKKFSMVSNATTGINIATDLILSLFPLTFLPQIRRPRMEKVLVGVLMGVGISAAAASIAKAVLVRQWATAVDSFAIGFRISTLTCVEMFLGIIAACSPSFKPAVQRLLTALGFDFRPSDQATFLHSFATNSQPATERRHDSVFDSTTQSKSTTKLTYVEMPDQTNGSSNIAWEGLENASDDRRKGSNGSDKSDRSGVIV